MIDVPQPVRTPMLDENGTPSRPWVAFFTWVYEKLRELAAAVAALESGGGSILPDQYVTLDPATVASSFSFGTLDYTAYSGITLDLAVDRQLIVFDPTFSGGAGAIAARTGKRLTLLMTFSGASPGISIGGIYLNAPTIANQTQTDTGGVYTQKASIEWRFREDGSAHVVSLYQAA